ncbi:MAG TPA: hypothetical protein VL688_09785 [Verrucomicrobiae bacterium]|jgi:RNA polymerase sigma-70 factor (ECF subfamily)|nr:hypothetical protein [Verrucomicrobiae bacterium]
MVYVLEEEVLMERYRKGDASALKSLIKLYEQKIFAFCFYAVGCDADKAYEAAVSGFVNAARSIPSLGGKASFLKQLLRQAITASKQSHALLSPDNSESSAAKLEIRKIVKRALLALPFEMKVFLLLRDQLNLSYELMASVLGKSGTDIKMELARSRKQLRENIEAIMANRDSLS